MRVETPDIRTDLLCRSRIERAVVILIAILLAACWLESTPAFAQYLAFPNRPAPAKKPAREGDPQMLVRADQIDYDYTNQRISAVGNVQIYYQGATIEGDKVIYDQKTKRLHGEGNVRLTEPDGKVTYGEIMDLSDDFRDGFVDSLRLDTPDATRMAAARGDRSGGNFTVFESGVYTACEPCKDDPKKPPLWQIKAARIVHDQGEKMIYFENARIEFYGMPMSYFPYFSTPDPTVKRKTGILIPTFTSSSVYGAAVEIPYFWALAPDYDVTLSPVITTGQGLLMKGEWEQRLINGSYSIRAAGIFQENKNYFQTNGDTPGFRDSRGSIETVGQFALTDRWVWGWAGTILSDKTFFQDYGLFDYKLTTDRIFQVPTEATSQLYLSGRGDRSYFDIRAINYQGLSSADVQSQIPVIYPVMDYNYTFKNPVLGGELGYKANLTNLSRATASFDPISFNAQNGGWCTVTTADPALKGATNCLLRGAPGDYSRFSSEADWRRTIVDSYGQTFTPFASLRGDVASMQINADPGVANFMTPGESQVGRVMPTVGVEYRYPFIGVESWGTQTIEPIAQIILRPDETNIGKFPNEDAQSLLFDDTNLFKIDKFSGWDRVEGGSRANVGIQYRAQFNHAGSLNVTFGQSYSLFGQNSFAVPDATNTGVNSGLDTSASDYVAGVTYQPNNTLTFTSHFRFDKDTFTPRRSEFAVTANMGRLTSTVMYGNYDAQPALGYLTRRQGILTNDILKVTTNWALLGGLRYDLQAGQVNQTQIGVGYIDDCLILAVNYLTTYSYAGFPTTDQTIMLQLALRTLGGTTVSQATTGPGALSNGIPGLGGNTSN